MVFDIAISNCADHLRNRVFLLTDNGRILSPAYEINPDPEGVGLKLNIDKSDNPLDFALAMDITPYFRLEKQMATTMPDNVKSTISAWRKAATDIGISRQKQDYVAPAYKD